jgi:hypothetical protein
VLLPAAMQMWWMQVMNRYGKAACKAGGCSLLALQLTFCTARTIIYL